MKKVIVLVGEAVGMSMLCWWPLRHSPADTVFVSPTKTGYILSIKTPKQPSLCYLRGHLHTTENNQYMWSTPPRALCCGRSRSRGFKVNIEPQIGTAPKVSRSKLITILNQKDFPWNETLSECNTRKANTKPNGLYLVREEIVCLSPSILVSYNVTTIKIFFVFHICPILP